ncbi:MAG: glycolate oxidase [Sphingobacteriales bacterium]|jgi:glycolate oxidase
MVFKSLSEDHKSRIRRIIGSDFVSSSNEELERAGRDETEDLLFKPEIVVKPQNTDQVSVLLKYCNEQLIPVTPRGAGTGLSGGALPIMGGVSLDMSLFNDIIDIDERNLQATVEPGVITQVFQEAVKEKGLFYPPDPSSKGSCFLGGNLAESAGGPRAVKYGTTKDYVLNMQVVLPNGDVIWTGANVLKNATGYNLTQLMVGSEGTLGVITKVVFRLIPHPKTDLLLLVSFNSVRKACEAVSAVFREGIAPSALEFMERECIVWGNKYNELNFDLADDVEGFLLIEVDGDNEDVLFKDCERISDVMYRFDCTDILFADSTKQKEKLWKMRRGVAEAVKANSIYKEEDTVVPRAELPELLVGIKKIGKEFGFKSVCYGHAGDGNLHVNIVKGDMSQSDWENKLPLGIEKIFLLVKRLGGTISGEHGIGMVQKAYMPIMFSVTVLELMKAIKKVFDPNGILNPGKIFPDS